MEQLKQKLGRFGEAIYTYWPGFSGRATRRELGYVLCAIAAITIALEGPWFTQPAYNTVWAGLMGLGRLILYPLLIWALLSAMLRRFHDSGRTWLWFFTILIPKIGIGFILYGLFVGPDVYDNDHGPNPRHL